MLLSAFTQNTVQIRENRVIIKKQKNYYGTIHLRE
jgi:hypothetical protein